MGVGAPAGSGSDARTTPAGDRGARRLPRHLKDVMIMRILLGGVIDEWARAGMGLSFSKHGSGCQGSEGRRRPRSLDAGRVRVNDALSWPERSSAPSTTPTSDTWRCPTA